jgi:macrolide transport system ATP-binding/permease protein
MDWIRVLVSRCAAFIFAKKLDADLEDELRSHLELATAENVERGMSEEPPELRRFVNLAS